MGGIKWLNGGIKWLNGGIKWLNGGIKWLNGGIKWLNGINSQPAGSEANRNDPRSAQAMSHG